MRKSDADLTKTLFRANSRLVSIYLATKAHGDWMTTRELSRAIGGGDDLDLLNRYALFLADIALIEHGRTPLHNHQWRFLPERGTLPDLPQDVVLAHCVKLAAQLPRK